MRFGGPTHRLQAQMKATATVLDLELSCMYLPDMMLISFDDAATGTSSLKLVKQGGAFDIAKLQASYKLYWKASETLTTPLERLLMVFLGHQRRHLRVRRLRRAG